MCVLCQQLVLTMLGVFDSDSSVNAVYHRAADSSILPIIFRVDSKHGKYDCYQTLIT